MRGSQLKLDDVGLNALPLSASQPNVPEVENG